MSIPLPRRHAYEEAKPGGQEPPVAHGLYTRGGGEAVAKLTFRLEPPDLVEAVDDRGCIFAGDIGL